MDTPIAIAKGAEIGGSCTAFTCAVLNWLSANHEAMGTVIGFCGVGIAASGFLVSAYYQYQRNKREREDYNSRQFQRRSTDPS